MMNYHDEGQFASNATLKALNGDTPTAKKTFMDQQWLNANENKYVRLKQPASKPNQLGHGGCDVAEIWMPIVVAVITGPIVVVLQKLRKENTSQHAEGRILLRSIGNKVDKIGSKLDQHIGWHDGKEQK
jgi:hypothetical protein